MLRLVLQLPLLFVFFRMVFADRLKRPPSLTPSPKTCPDRGKIRTRNLAKEQLLRRFKAWGNQVVIACLLSAAVTPCSSSSSCGGLPALPLLLWLLLVPQLLCIVVQYLMLYFHYCCRCHRLAPIASILVACVFKGLCVYLGVVYVEICIWVNLCLCSCCVCRNMYMDEFVFM